MRCKSMMAAAFVILLSAITLWAQVQAPPAPWRDAGPTPCVGSDGGVYECPPAPRVVAIRAGCLFGSKTSHMFVETSSASFGRANHGCRTRGPSQYSAGAFQ
jgi:hypothetical protein